ncbi:MAG: sigma-70 family RNA polymerase sigma factor [Gammaproteobacteria bacterium]|nr:sigma-70 family RNA polymerase sigma factor [Gammaproteobacteria bacterium]
MSLDVGALYERHEPEIRRFVCDRLRGHAAPDSEDVAATVWERVIKAAQAYENIGREKNWLYMIARNLARDHYRTPHWRLINGSIPEHRLYEEDHPQHEDRHPSDYADLHAALDTLTPEQRRVIVLRYWYGFPFAETAALLGTTEDGVKKLAIRARARLRRYLEEAA